MPPITYDHDEFSKDLNDEQIDRALAIANHIANNLSDEEYAVVTKIAPAMVKARHDRDRILEFAQLLAQIGLGVL